MILLILVTVPFPLLFVLFEKLSLTTTAITAEVLAATAAILLSLLFSYVPGFTNFFEKLAPNSKRLVMLALLAITAVGAFGVSCAGWGDLADPMVACTQAGFWGLAKVFVTALIANQAAYLISPKPS
jgi:hypothetical protein